jgi:type 1 glutamine amidotransferase
MRTFTFFAATLGLAALIGACSDGTGLIPGPGGGSTSSASGSGDMPLAGTSAIPTAGATAVGGTGSTDGGSGTVAGSSSTAGSSTGGSVSAGGTGGTGTTDGGSSSGGSGGTGTVDPYSGPFKILVLTTTLDFYHDSVPICSLMVGVEGAFDFIQNGTHITGANLRQEVEVKQNRGTQLPSLGQTPDAMMPMGTKPGSQWTAVLAKHDLSDFTDENLKQYAMVFSCNPTGTVFSNNPNVKDDKAIHMAALQKYVENGGAWGGVHSATDFEKANGFPWFVNTLVGGYFDHHDGDGTSGTVQVNPMFKDHPVMRNVPATWSTQDEWYYMNRDIGAQPGFQILARLGDNRPVVWVKEVGKGRSFYTIRGHNRDRFDKEPAYRQLVLNGILWATHRLEK